MPNSETEKLWMRLYLADIAEQMMHDRQENPPADGRKVTMAEIEAYVNDVLKSIAGYKPIKFHYPLEVEDYWAIQRALIYRSLHIDIKEYDPSNETPLVYLPKGFRMRSVTDAKKRYIQFHGG